MDPRLTPFLQRLVRSAHAMALTPELEDKMVFDLHLMLEQRMHESFVIALPDHHRDHYIRMFEGHSPLAEAVSFVQEHIHDIDAHVQDVLRDFEHEYLSWMQEYDASPVSAAAA